MSFTVTWLHSYKGCISATGAGSDQVVRLLVERGIAVHEIAPMEETLEEFYLSLMNGK